MPSPRCARAPAAGKALVFMPMNNLDYKYRQFTVRDFSTGGTEHPAFGFDETLTMVWHEVGGSGSTLQAGVMDSLFESGLFWFVQSFKANQKHYGLYLVDPGRYALIGLTYHLFDATLPALASGKWTSTPDLGVAALSTTRDTTFSHQAQWTNAQYKDTQVYDGSSGGGATVSGGGVTACVSWDDHYHTETKMTDSGGWRENVSRGYTGGMDVAVKFAKPFAMFDVGAGDLIVTDGLSAVPTSVVFDEKACPPDRGKHHQLPLEVDQAVPDRGQHPRHRGHGRHRPKTRRSLDRSSIGPRRCTQASWRKSPAPTNRRGPRRTSCPHRDGGRRHATLDSRRLKCAG